MNFKQKTTTRQPDSNAVSTRAFWNSTRETQVYVAHEKYSGYFLCQRRRL